MALTTTGPQLPQSTGSELRNAVRFTRGIAYPKGSTIPVAGPWITRAEVERVVAAALGSWYDGAGGPTREFEHAFAAYTGRRYAISLPSCSAGLHLSLLALDLTPGDEVVVPDNTWIASAAFIKHVGATTVFADIDRDTWVITPESLEAAITPRTKAVIAVELYGSMPDYNRLLDVCRRHNIALIEDCAESIGSSYNDTLAGKFGDISVFSFHGAKTMSTGEGGMAVTDNQGLYERMEFLRDHGRMPGDRTFRHTEVAWKYKMTDLQAALGLAQLERIDELVEHKRRIFGWYQEHLAGVAGIRLNAEPANVYNSYWMSTVVLDPSYGIEKDELGERLKAADIASRPFFYPLSSLPAYADHPQAGGAQLDRPNSYEAGQYGVNLPSALCLEEPHIAYVCNVLKGILKA